MDKNNEIDISEFYQTPLSSLVLPDNYAKLIKYIMRLNGSSNSLGEVFIVESVGDIIALEPYQFSQCKGVGNNYIERLIEFKKELPSFLRNLKQEEKVIELQPKITLSTEQLETPLNTISLVSTQYKRLIKRISSAIDNVTTVKDIIDLNPVYFSNLPGIGKINASQLIELQNKLPKFLESQSKKSALFNDNYSIEFNEIDDVLLEDIENYLWT